MNKAVTDSSGVISTEALDLEADTGRDETLKKALVAISSLKDKLAAERHRATEDIAIVGMACRFPGGCETPEAFWTLLQQGERTVGPVPASRWDTDEHYNPVPGTPGKMYVKALNFVDGIEQFDCQFFGVTPKEARSLDPHQRILLQLMWHALEDAGITAASIRGSDAAVFMGQSSSDYSLRLNRYNTLDEMDGFVATGNNYSVTSGRMSYLLGINGPCMTLDTACSSSLVCLNQAVEALRNRRTGLAFVGASHVMSTPESCLALSHAQALAPDGMSKPFDDKADGYGRGEGGAVVLLKRVSDAERDGDPILAIVQESVINQDGASGGLMVPNGNAQAALIESALRRSGLKADDLQYIEAHGTGTPIGDPIEAAAIGSVLGGPDRSEPLLMGSCKANIGHLEAASGMAALVKVVMMLQQREIVAQPGFSEPSRQIDWQSMSVEVPTEGRPWVVPPGVVRRAGINGFGFSGMNGHAILKEYTPARQESTELAVADDVAPPLLGLSAKHPDALSRLCGLYATRLQAGDLDAVCRAATQYRDHFAHRVAVTADGAEDMVAALAAYANGKHSVNLVQGGSSRPAKTVFMFTGQGAQYVGMGRYLYDTQPVFRDVFDRCNTAVSDVLGRDLVALVFDGDDSTLSNTAFTQPALFALEVALAALWRHWGVEPLAVVGHSVGQYAAACVAGVFTVEDGARLIALRGQLMAQLPEGGGMLAIAADAETVGAMLQDQRRLDIAAINGPQQTVVSGDADKLDVILTECERRGISCQPLNVSHAFHSPLMEPILTQFLDSAAKVSFASPNIELMCNLSGEFADLNVMLTPEYWMRHIREAVDFNGCIERLLEQGYDCFLEIGPAPVLCAMGQVVERHLDRDARWIPTLRRPRTDDQSEARRQIQLAIAGTYCAGVDLDWSAVQGGPAPRRIALPNYPFEPKWFWPEGDSTRHEDTLPSGSPLHALLNGSDASGVAALMGRLTEQGCVTSSQKSVAEQVLNQLRAWHSLACEYGDLDDWFYELCWESSELPGVPKQRPGPSHWLVLIDNAGCSMADQMQRALEQADYSVSVVETGHLTSSEIEEFLADVLPTIPAVDHCLLLSHWSADGYGADGSDTDFDAVRSQSVDLLLVLAQRLELMGSAARIWIPTVQVWDVGLTEPGVGHLHSPLWIMMRNLYREMPHRVGAVIDLERGAPTSELVGAIDQLAGVQSQHEYQWLLRGKQVFVPRLQAAPSLPSGRSRRWSLDGDARYLVTGPFGGIGLALTQLLVDRGARHLCLVSRSGPVTEDAAAAVRRWRDSGIEVDTPTLDVADSAAVAELFSAMDDRHPLRGVFHTAGTTADGMLEDLTPADFERVLRPKMIGTGLLDKHTRSIPLDFFVCFSSTSALLGAPGLANYASANFYMDALMAERRRLGLAGFSIQWGTWAEVGMVAKLGQMHLKRQAAQGWRLIGTGDGMRALERIMIANQSGQRMPDTPIVMPVSDWSRVLTVLGGRQDAQFARLAERFSEDDDLESGVDEAVAALLALPREEQRGALTQKLKSKIAIGFGFEEAELSVDESLVSLGMDSLLAVQLKMALQKMLGVDLPMEVLLQGASISEIAAQVLRELPSPEDARANSLDSARQQEQVSMVL